MTKLAPDALLARVIIGMISTTAILYSWVTPLIVSALEQTPNITAEAAGYVFSANLYGTALGGFLAIGLTSVLPWRMSCLVLVIGIAVLDFTSIWIVDPTSLTLVRFAHGVLGGVLMGFGVLILTRAGQPERTLSITLGIQTLLGGSILVGVAPLIDSLGIYPIWICLITVAIVTLFTIPFLADYPTPAKNETASTSNPGFRLSPAPTRIVILTMLALFVYQATQMAPYVYIIELGQSYALSDSFLGLANGIAIWFGGVAAAITAYWSTRSGYAIPAVGGCLVSALGVALLSYPSSVTYFIASVGFAFFFTIAIVYLLALFSVLDETGRFATVGSFINTIGLASGPLLAATFLTRGFSYVDIVWVGAIGMVLAGLLVLMPARYVER